MEKPYLNRNISGAIKGIAIIFMFIHHLFTFPDWYVGGISYPALSLFARIFCWPLKICVSVFAFLTGYFYFFGKQQTFRYSLRKVTDVLISYWAVYLPLLLLAVMLGCWRFDWTAFVRGLLALDDQIMLFGWYICFYILFMLLMPVIARLSLNSLGKDIVMLLVLPVAAFTALRKILGDSDPGRIFASMVEWFPCVISGYLFAKYSLFETVLEKITGTLHGKISSLLFFTVMLCAAMMGRYVCPRFRLGGISIAGEWLELVFTMDVLYAPLFIFAAANLLLPLKDGIALKPLESMGKQSLLMWLLHCVFFNVCKAYTQPVLYFLKNPVLVLLFGLSICYLAAQLIDLPLKRVLKLKNKYMA